VLNVILVNLNGRELYSIPQVVLRWSPMQDDSVDTQRTSPMDSLAISLFLELQPGKLVMQPVVVN